jgi:sterol desaturase/sphingolipid hydroxylase (fatty acid hydroxylase superfamily)
VERLLSTLHQAAAAITHGVIALAVGFILFSFMERLFEFSHGKKPWRAYLLDLQHTFLSMIYPPFIHFILSIIFGLLALQYAAAIHDSQISPVLFVAELFAILFLRDCLIYIRHRIFHTRPVWPFHSIHHSSEEVNWISAVRFHPAESLIESAAEILLFLGCNLIDFDPLVLSVASLAIGFYNLFIHANLRWTFGPLRYFLVSPVFHRWHHSDAPAAQDKNFAAMFSCIDWTMGTFYMPVDSTPQTLGLPPQEKPIHPRTLAKQLLYPFRKR